MNNFAKRSYKKEILDGDAIPFADIRQNLKELNIINTLLGGHKITIEGIKNILDFNTKIPQLTVCEVGCGGGDNLKAIENWSVKNNIKIQFIGIDIKRECIEFAQQQYPSLNCHWIISNYEDVIFNNTRPDIIFSSLFCHHFTEAELIKILQWKKEQSTKGFFINDLHRNRLAFYSIKFITQLFSRSYLVKNDAPLSVARGFITLEWRKLFQEAGIKKYIIQWKWAFRHLIIFKHEAAATI